MRNETLAVVVAVFIGIIAYAVYVSKQKQKVEKEAKQLLLAVSAEQSEKELAVNEKNSLLNENQHLNAVLHSFNLNRDSRGRF